MSDAPRFRGKYRIPSARWQRWDYGWDGAYFITIVTKNRIHFFGEIRNGKIYLSKIGQIAKKFWYEIPEHFPFVRLDAFVVMPNHIHGILIIDKKTQNKNENVPVETGHDLSLPGNDITPGKKRFRNPGRGTVSTIIGLYKSAVTKISRQIDTEFGWQFRFYDRVIRDDLEFYRIRKYIINNPKKWSNDRNH